MRTPYYARPDGSASKLSTWRDGFRILWTIFKLYRAERPLPFFAALGIALAHHLDRPRHPDLHHLSAGRVWCRGCRRRCFRPGLMLLAFLSFACGLILDTVTRGRRELKLLAYLAQRAPGEERRRS